MSVSEVWCKCASATYGPESLILARFAAQRRYQGTKAKLCFPNGGSDEQAETSKRDHEQRCSHGTHGFQGDCIGVDYSQGTTAENHLLLLLHDAFGNRDRIGSGMTALMTGTATQVQSGLIRSRDDGRPGRMAVEEKGNH